MVKASLGMLFNHAELAVEDNALGTALSMYQGQAGVSQPVRLTVKTANRDGSVVKASLGMLFNHAELAVEDNALGTALSMYQGQAGVSLKIEKLGITRRRFASPLELDALTFV